jgi:hypothetical protein
VCVCVCVCVCVRAQRQWSCRQLGIDGRYWAVQGAGEARNTEGGANAKSGWWCAAWPWTRRGSESCTRDFFSRDVPGLALGSVVVSCRSPAAPPPPADSRSHPSIDAPDQCHAATKGLARRITLYFSHICSDPRPAASSTPRPDPAAARPRYRPRSTQAP